MFSKKGKTNVDANRSEAEIRKSNTETCFVWFDDSCHTENIRTWLEKKYLITGKKNKIKKTQ